jgi:hypothetical protein
MEENSHIGNLNSDILSKIFEFSPTRSLLNTARVNRKKEVFTNAARNVVRRLRREYSNLTDIAKYAEIDDLINFLSYEPLSKEDRMDVLNGLASRKPEYFELFKKIVDSLDEPEETLVVLKPMIIEPTPLE